jgi:methyl-accepting chemotaxis protein
MIFGVKNSIRTKLSFSVGIFASTILLTIIGFVTYKMRQDALENAEKLALAESREYAKQVQIELERAFVANRTLCETIGSVKNSPPTNLNRDAVNTILKDFLASFPDFLGAYTVWEPNAFDNHDSSFINSTGHDKTGRFIPYWYRDGGIVKQEAIVGYESTETAPWYFQPQESGKETVMDPFYYQGLYMVSIINPIVKNGTFNGITGVDMSMAFIQKLVDDFNLYNNQASITILSDAGNIVAASKKPNLAGKSIDGNLQNIPKGLFADKTELTANISDTIRAFVPFQLGETGKTWVTYIQIPEKVFIAGSNNMLLALAAIGLFTIVLLVWGIYFFADKLTKPILSIAQMADDVSKGTVNKDLSFENTSEEVSLLQASFKKIVEAQNDITIVCKAISDGDFSKKAVVRSTNDELSIAVNKMTQNLIVAASEDKKRNWATEGLALFADLLRSESDLKKLSDIIIMQLIKYLNANQGGIFFFNDENPKDQYLELISCYAYERKKYLERKIAIGEGLIGQCFLEKESIVLLDVPNNYVKITSGLGLSNPRFILVVPLKREETILGVMEIASFTVLEDYQIKFVEKLAESIASSIYNIIINNKTSELLKQSQMQAEEMRAQEEEMRQNMEELQATQEEMFRKEQDYISEIERLKAGASV